MWEPIDIKFRDHVTHLVQESITSSETAFEASYSFAFSSGFSSTYNSVFREALAVASATDRDRHTDSGFDLDPATHLDPDLDLANHRDLDLDPANDLDLHFNPATHSNPDLYHASHPEPDLDPARLGVRGLDLSRHGVRGLDLARHGVRGLDLARHGVRGLDLSRHGVRGLDLSQHGVRDLEPARHGVRGLDLARHGVRGLDLARRGVRVLDLARHGVRDLDLARHGVRDLDLARHGVGDLDPARHAVPELDSGNLSDPDLDPACHLDAYLDPVSFRDPDLDPANDNDPDLDPALAKPATVRTPVTDASSKVLPRRVSIGDFASPSAFARANAYARAVAHRIAHSIAIAYAKPFGRRALLSLPSPEVETETPPGSLHEPLGGPRLLRELPDEFWRGVFSHLLERDLCRVSQVCRRFTRIADDPELWRRLYEDLYEYDRPLINPAPCHFQFCARELSGAANPWREAFLRLYDAVHVRPGFRAKAPAGRDVMFFDTVQGALAACHRSLFASADPDRQLVVFVHAGTYRVPPLVVRANVALIGAAADRVAESVVIECESGTTLKLTHGATMAYVGHLTLKLSPRQTSSALHLSCLEVSGDCSPTIERCFIRSSFAISAAVRVRGPDAHPDIRYCVITDCQRVGLCCEDETEGEIKGNLINRDLCKRFPKIRR